MAEWSCNGDVPVKTLRTTQFAADAAQLIVSEAQSALKQRGLFRVGLCGGSTPKAVYSELAKAQLPWEKLLFTFGDERCVEPGSDQSNFRMANEALFLPAGVPDSSIFRMRGELPPEEAAAEYEAKLSAVAKRFNEPRYVHDLLLLGLGDDGHTASLFPGTGALKETGQNVVANFVPKFNSYRISFTYPLINAAKHVVFLVNDPKKAAVIEAVQSGTSDFPAGKVKAAEVSWILGE